MNLDYLRYFVKLAELRHYTKAAQQLCITQPSLSHAIRQLETELGVWKLHKCKDCYYHRADLEMDWI